MSNYLFGIIVKSDGNILSRYGCEDITRLGIEALKTWERGEKVSRSSSNQYVWSSITCNGCKMFPLIGQRYKCTICDNYNLCSTCQNKGHEHPLELEQQPKDDHQ